MKRREIVNVAWCGVKGAIKRLQPLVWKREAKDASLGGHERGWFGPKSDLRAREENGAWYEGSSNVKDRSLKPHSWARVVCAEPTRVVMTEVTHEHQEETSQGRLVAGSEGSCHPSTLQFIDQL